MIKPPIVIAREVFHEANWKDFFRGYDIILTPPQEQPFIYVTGTLFTDYHWERLLQTPEGAHLLIYGEGTGQLSISPNSPFLIRTVSPSFHVDGLTYGGISLLTHQKELTLEMTDKRAIIAEKKWPLPQPALFLDRDGILVRDNHYVIQYENHSLRKDFITPLVAALSQKLPPETMVFVVSNQSGIGRGFFSPAQLKILHQKLDLDIRALGLSIVQWHFCPYHKVHGKGEYKRDSFSRKPYPGMVLKICEQYQVDLKQSWMIGDQLTDDLSLPQLKTLHLQGEKDLSQATSPVFTCPKELIRALV